MLHHKKFYVVTISDETIRDCLNGIRLLGNPNEKYEVHLTVRGPYSPNSHEPKVVKSFKGGEIKVKKVDNFFNPVQNTVFFRCESAYLSEFWWKTDYDYNPHITLYDGNSREFAQRLYSLLSEYSYNITFNADKLTPLRKQQNNASFWLKDAESRISYYLGETYDFSKIIMTGDSAKIDMIRKIIEYLCVKGYAHNSILKRIYTFDTFVFKT